MNSDAIAGGLREGGENEYVKHLGEYGRVPFGEWERGSRVRYAVKVDGGRIEYVCDRNLSVGELKYLVPGAAICAMVYSVFAISLSTTFAIALISLIAGFLFSVLVVILCYWQMQRSVTMELSLPPALVIDVKRQCFSLPRFGISTEFEGIEAVICTSVRAREPVIGEFGVHLAVRWRDRQQHRHVHVVRCVPRLAAWGRKEAKMLAEAIGCGCECIQGWGHPVPMRDLIVIQ